MKKPIDTIRERLRRDRPMATVTMRLPEDVVDELKRVAPLLGIAGYQPLIRAYIGCGLREYLARLEASPLQLRLDSIAEKLREQGVDDTVIAHAMIDA